MSASNYYSTYMRKWRETHPEYFKIYRKTGISPLSNKVLSEKALHGNIDFIETPGGRKISKQRGEEIAFQEDMKKVFSWDETDCIL